MIWVGGLVCDAIMLQELLELLVLCTQRQRSNWTISSPKRTWKIYLQLSGSPSFSSRANLLLMFAMEMRVAPGYSEWLRLSTLLADHTLLYELLNVISYLGPKYSVSCSMEASLLTLVTLMYVLEHLWSHLPWYYDSVSTSNES